MTVQGTIDPANDCHRILANGHRVHYGDADGFPDLLAGKEHEIRPVLQIALTKISLHGR